MSPRRRSPIPDWEQQQDEFDRTPICPKCGTVCDHQLDYCLECGRKVRRDTDRGGARDGEVEMPDYLKRSFGRRLTDFRDAAGLTQDDGEALFEREPDGDES